jgi:dienelactone hydrolase
VHLGRPARLLAAAVTAVAVCATAAPASAQDAAFATSEAANFAMVGQAPQQQVTDPAFGARWQQQSLANIAEFVALGPARALATTGNLCREWAEQCTGDPFRYPGVDPFYDTADVVPVSFLDRGGAQLFGRVWSPKGATSRLPGVVITNGSVQAPETLYWWGAQALVDAGYVVMTFDPRGQGRSDNRTPSGEMGSNANPDVFATNTIDAIDFFHSTPDAPYEGNVAGDTRAVTAFNPLHAAVDRERLGAVGHSLGARGVSVVQGVTPWPGTGDTNPIDAVVAWDNLALSEGAGADGGLAGFPLVPRVPAMGQSADYFLTPTPYTSPPDPDGKRGGFLSWQQAGIPSYQLVVQGGTHYEWSLLPTFPTSAWEAGGDGGWGNPLARHFTVAWLDRWLKVAGEQGFDDADARLLDLSFRPAAGDLQGGDQPASWCERLSFHFTSSYAFPARDGVPQDVVDLADSCEAAAAGTPASAPPPAGPSAAPSSSPAAAAATVRSPDTLPATGGTPALTGLALLAAGAALGRRRRSR